MRYVLAALLIAHGAAHGAFRCTAPDGRVAFQDTPCAPTAQAEALVLRDTSLAGDRPPYILDAIARRVIVNDMTRSEVVGMLGQPTSRSRRVGPAGVSEQLVYRQHRRTLYVYLRDGFVTSHSATEH